MQRGGGIEAERFPAAVGDHHIHTGALVHFVEVRKRAAGIQLVVRSLGEDRRTISVVQHAFGEVGGGRHVFESLLVLDADGVAAEFVRDAHGGDVHLALVEHLIEREFGGSVFAEIEFDAFGDQPLVDGIALRRR